MNRIFPAKQYVYVLGGDTLRPISIYNAISVGQDGIGGKFFVRGNTSITGQSITDRLTPERDTIEEAQQDLAALFASLNGDSFASEPLPADRTELNLK